jgi:hypothetical protein
MGTAEREIVNATSERDLRARARVTDPVEPNRSA